MPAIKKPRTSKERVAAHRARLRQQGLKPVQLWVGDAQSPGAAVEAHRRQVVADPALKRYRAALNEIYGDRIERVVLYGSRARGDAHKESDYDVAVFLQRIPNRWQELDRLADLSTQFIEDDGPFIHAMPFPAGAYDDPTTLMHEVRTDGIDL